MNGHVAAAILVVLAITAGVGPAAAAQGSVAPSDGIGADDRVEQTEAGLEQTSPEELDPDEIRLEIALNPDGSAEWTVEFWVRLDEDERVEAFESLAADAENDPEELTGEFAARMEGTAAAASEATGREMSVDDVDVEAERQSFATEYGVLRYTFTWHGFAAVEDDQLHAGDAIEGLFLEEGSRLLVGWPDGYELVSATPEPDDRRDRAVLWRGGDTDFVSGEPRVVVAPTRGWLPFAAAGAGGLVLVALVALWYRRRSAAETPTEGTELSYESGTEPAPEGESATGGSSPATDPPTELLSNEEQVLRLVADNGGRMKQQAVVEELGWTDAKTSKVVSTLREEGELESFRLGRENVLSLPDADPEREE